MPDHHDGTLPLPSSKDLNSHTRVDSTVLNWDNDSEEIETPLKTQEYEDNFEWMERQHRNPIRQP